jgi:calcineurin-like phosphoesterase family protein
MSCVYISSDWHLGHKNIPQYRSHVTSVEDNYTFIGDNYTLRERDILILLGDIVFEPKAFEFIQKLPAAKKVLVLGNHDWERFKANMSDIASTFNEVVGVKTYKHCWLTHMPIVESEFRGKILNIHGHIHNEERNPEIRDNPSYVNVNVDVIYAKHKKIVLEWGVMMEMAKARLAQRPSIIS